MGFLFLLSLHLVLPKKVEGGPAQGMVPLEGQPREPQVYTEQAAA
jgi:hypothetical protein